MKKGVDKEVLPADLSRQSLLRRRKEETAAVKADMSRRLAKDVTAGLADVDAASEADLVTLAEQLTTRNTQLFPNAERGWFKLFRLIDEDKSGQIDYEEFSRVMVRGHLKLSALELPERSLQAAWKAIDTDASGFISVGEFGRLMKRGSAMRERQAAALETEGESNRRRRLVEAERTQRKLELDLVENQRMLEASQRAAAMAQQMERDAAILEAKLKSVAKGITKRSPSSLRDSTSLPALDGARRGATSAQQSQDVFNQGPRATAGSALQNESMLPPLRIGFGVDF